MKYLLPIALLCYLLGLYTGKEIYAPHTPPHPEQIQNEPLTPNTSLPTQTESIPNGGNASNNTPTNTSINNKQFTSISTEEQMKIREIADLAYSEDLDKLAERLGDKSATVRLETIKALVRIDTEASMRVVGQALFSDISESNRIAAIEFLSYRTDLDFAQHFIRAAANTDKSERVRIAAQELQSGL